MEATLSVKHGPQSREYFHLAYGLASVIALQVVNAAHALEGYKTLLSLSDVAIILYLAYLSSWMRNKVINVVNWWQNREES